MSSTPTSFASAAAGQSRGRGDEWARKDGRSVNGTLTFRRQGTASNLQQPFATPGAPASSTTAPTEPLSAQSPQYTMPPVDANGRYGRDEFFDIYRATGAQSTPRDVSSLFVNNWDPNQVNGGARGWGKSAEGTIPQDPTVCWEPSGSIRPMGIQAMTEQEQELFADVNSTLKPQQPKDANNAGTTNTANNFNTAANGTSGAAAAPGPIGVGGLNGRKASVSNTGGTLGSANSVTNNASNPLAAVSSRPLTRRQNTSDASPFSSPFSGGASLTSPLGIRSPRDESSWFGRKTADAKTKDFPDDTETQPSAAASRAPVPGSLSRANTAGSVLGNAASLWGGSNASANPPSAGAFGNFALPTPVGDKRFGSMRGESRLAHLIPKDSNEPVAVGPKASGPTASATSVAPPSTTLASIGGGIIAGDSVETWRSRQRTDTDPFGQSASGHQASASVGSALETPARGGRGDFGMSGLNIGSGPDNEATGSPDTNPYRSPAASGNNGPEQHPQAPSLSTLGSISNNGPEGTGPFGSLRGGFGPYDPNDRSQNTSGAGRGFSGLGNIAGWGNPIGTTTPDRERTPFNAFGSSLFSPGGSELSSGFGAVPGAGVFGAPGAGPGPTGSMRSTTSKLNAFLPNSIQASMGGHNQEAEGGTLNGNMAPELRQPNPLSVIGRDPVASQANGDARAMRGVFDEADRGYGQGSQPGLSGTPASLAATFDAPPHHGDLAALSSRTMVMPDRMRWVYLDPQGQIQGPFTGLEMNDWYKANFFTADLRVKKVEDSEFEALGQLIRQIGNSREPFLVPLMGIPHGQPSLSGTYGNHGSVIPPLVNAFPSYGRTLTAEEQNNLERRKQEEQYMNARQREMQGSVSHIPTSFGSVRPGAIGAPAGALHHHSSAHSLQSQPSFGSITSPMGTAPPQIPGQIGSSSFFDHTGMPHSTQPPFQSSSEFLRDTFNLQDHTLLPGTSQQTLGAVGNMMSSQVSPSAQPVGQSLDPNNLTQLPTADQLLKDHQGFSERLLEFQRLRESMPDNDDTAEYSSNEHQSENLPPSNDTDEATAIPEHQVTNESSAPAPASPMSGRSFSHRAASSTSTWEESGGAALQQAPSPAPHSSLPMPLPPPQGEATIAAPTAQRTRSTLPEQYNTASRSQSPEETSPGGQTPALAPWALHAENHRGPSLREIQAAEAKKAAKAEEIAAAARKIAAEQEAALLREREKAAAAVAPGLPTSSTWAKSSPVPSTGSSSISWGKPAVANLTPASTTATGTGNKAADRKKTLAEIQREEEARKQKIQQASQASSGLSSNGGKRYAELASRAQPSSPSVASFISPAAAAAAAAANAGSGWATVGAGGKVKTPLGSAASRFPMVAPPANKPVATARAASRTVSGTGRSDNGAALDEFNKWALREISRGASAGIDVNEFIENLRALPTDAGLIADAVYGASQTMDARHFAEEYVRRKKLAEKGVFEARPPAANSVSSSSGWSEVAKKSSTATQPKEESMPPGFRVVPTRKKGRK